MSDYNNTTGTIAGVAAGWAAYKYLPKFKKPYGRWVFTEFEKIPEAQNNRYFSAAQKAFKRTQLNAKNVDVIDINPNNSESVIKNTLDKSNKNIENYVKKTFGLKEQNIKKKKPRPKWKYILFGPSGEEKMKEMLKKVADGKNACFHIMSGNVLVNKNKMGFSTFHEIGHAINANSSKLAKSLVIGSHLTAKIAAPILLATALIKKQNPVQYNRRRRTHKDNNMLKDNIGLITFGCLTPVLIEEGMASINGIKMAKKVLKPSETKNLKCLYGKAWSTYLIGAIFAGACAQLAVYIKDKLTQKN